MNTYMSSRPYTTVAILTMATLLAAGSVRGEIVIFSGGMDASVDVEVDFNSDGSADIANGGFEDVFFPSPQFSISQHVRTDPSTPFFGEGAAYQNQFGINATYVDSRDAMADGGRFYGEAITTYRAGFSATQDPFRNIPFSFVINSGELRIRNINNFHTSDSSAPSSVSVLASVGLSTDSMSLLWSFEPILKRDGVNGPFMVTQSPSSSDTANLGFPTLGVDLVDVDGDGVADDAVVTIPRIQKTVIIERDDFLSTIGDVDTGKPVLSYYMGAFVDLDGTLGAGGLAGISDPFALGTPNDPSDDLNGSFSPLGVEFFIDGRPLSDLRFVPEPSALGLLMVGLPLLLRRRARRANVAC